MKAAEPLGIKMIVLDRPNPIGDKVEGTVLDPAYTSFVGLAKLPMRHGLTAGEIATHFKAAYYHDCELEVVHLEGWKRDDYLDECELPWTMPSPNMPATTTPSPIPDVRLNRTNYRFADFAEIGNSGKTKHVSDCQISFAPTGHD